MGMFKGVGGADKPKNGGNYIKDGKYLLRIDNVKAFENRKGDKRVAVEGTIVKVLDAGSMGGHRVGEQVCQMLNPSWDQFLSHVRGIVECAMRCDFDQMTPAQAEEACNDVVGESQPLAGTICELNCSLTLTKSDKEFVVIRWQREIDPRTVLNGEAGIPEADLERLYPADQRAELEMLAEMRAEESAE